MPETDATYARRAGLTRLAADAQLAAIVGERLYPQQRPANPQWPFVGWGVMIESEFKAACMDGTTLDFVVHSYAATEGTGDDTIMGEERADAMNGRVRAVLDDQEIDLAEFGSDAAATAHFTWLGSQVIQDNKEADQFHGISSWRVNVSR